jgi:integrase/recombinase XerD
MKALPLQSAHYLYWLQSFEQWLQIIGYSESAVTNWPTHVRELLSYVNKEHDILTKFFTYLNKIFN